MNLPAVVEIAIGLLFIYLTLSLLASEIQELITIVLQWRAEHLKKSIENLLDGEWHHPTVQKFTDEFYKTPLIQALNQEGRGELEGFWRRIVQQLIRFYTQLFKTKQVLGPSTSAPSYIPAATFSAALMQKLHIRPISQKISELVARKIVQAKLAQLTEILADWRNSSGDHSILAKEFAHLQQTVEAILQEFVNGRTSLTDCLEQITAQLTHFIDHAAPFLSESSYPTDLIRKRLPYFQQAIAQSQREPTITEVLQAIFSIQNTSIQNTSIQNTAAFSGSLNPGALSTGSLNAGPSGDPALTQLQPTSQSQFPHPSSDQQPLTAIVQLLQNDYADYYADWIEQVRQIPPPLQRSLASLAEQARLKATGLDNQVRQLEQEIAAWFDRSMDRASGVYRRNAKGVAILIGFLTAVLINADTFHMVDRLSKDSLIRATISQAADQVISQPLPTPALSPSGQPLPSPTGLEQIKDEVSTVLDELPLPIGWNPANTQTPPDHPWLMVWGKRFLGWLITGIALSMGAAFWYDLLQKVMQVRGTGKKP